MNTTRKMLYGLAALALSFPLALTAGNEIEKRVKKTTHYEVTVRLQGGGTQMISYAAEPPFRVGDKVKVESGALVANP